MDELIAYALGELEPERARSLEEEIQRDPALRMAMREIHEGFAVLAYLGAEEGMDDVRKKRVHSRLMRRVAEDRDAASARGRRGNRFRTWLLGGSGWAAAAILLVMVVTHHAFHEPLSSGWLVAAFLLAVAVVLGSYAFRLRRRLEGGRRSGGRS